MYALKMHSRDADESQLANQVRSANDSRILAMERAKQAEEAAKAAQQEAADKSSFVSTMSEIATVAACVAAVASVVVTGGASAPAVIALAGTLLSASSPLIAKECGEDWGKAAMYGGTALSLVGAGGTMFAAKAATTSVTVANVAKGTVIGARVVEGGARIGQGVGTIQQKKAEGDVVEAQAHVSAQKAALKRIQGDLESTVELMKEVEASARRAAQTILQIGNNLDESRAALVARIGRQA
jgi:hypothetical protein